MGEASSNSARRGRQARAKARASGSAAGPAQAPRGVAAGRYRPLSERQIQSIHKTSLEILERVGLAEAPPEVIALVTGRGGKVTAEGRLSFPPGLVEDAIEGLKRGFTLHGQRPGQELELSGAKVHLGTGGAAPSLVDLESGRYRPSGLQDLYDAARLVDALAHIHFFSRSLVARDLPDARSLDVNTAYACLAGTVKHACSSIALPDHVAEIAQLCCTIAGGQRAFSERPFLSLNINHVTPPLRFSPEACGVILEGARLGLPLHLNSFAQVGASSPVTLAGALAQTGAETLAGMVLAWLANPEVKAIYGARPMVVDLRSGAMSGGGGEQALVMAAATQMARFYDLPNSSIAGATDAKIADAQSGYEKSLAVTLAAQAGSNMVTQACGMQAGLLGCSFESYVIDNDMLGCVLQSLGAIEVSDETLSSDQIAEVVKGDGHYLGHPQTFARMESDFLYPEIADRRSPEVWEAAGAPDIRETARARAKEILESHYPDHLSAETDALLRANHDIRLPPRPGVDGK